ncbi:hypothetical protein BDF21DRAFT_401279 [Thamnidium elegans]|nr:hypothetical protein BDF21DRAFT_401279 [Thamnidium elegans]
MVKDILIIKETQMKEDRLWRRKCFLSYYKDTYLTNNMLNLTNRLRNKLTDTGPPFLNLALDHPEILQAAFYCNLLVTSSTRLDKRTITNKTIEMGPNTSNFIPQPDTRIYLNAKHLKLGKKNTT